MPEAEYLAKHIYECSVSRDWNSMIINCNKLLKQPNSLSQNLISKIHYTLAIAHLFSNQYSKTYENLMTCMKMNSEMKEDGEFLFKILKYEILKND